MSALAPLFAPKGIAVVGASADPAKPGHQVLKVLSRYEGPLTPVNPRGGTILGLPVARRVADVAGVDLAVLAVPPSAVPAAVAECAEAGVRAAVIVSGGFAETAAADLQAEVLSLARAGGIRLLGPNTSGFVNPSAGVYASFVPTATVLRPGRVAVVAQSGGVNHALAFALHDRGIGLSLGVGLGNAADVGFADVLDHLAGGPGTRAIALHVEGVADGRALFEAVARVTPRTPVAALVAGRADTGDFARSHTGALTGAWALTRAALAQAGAVVVDDSAELVDAVAALSIARLPPGRVRVGVVTGQAGPGLLLTDTLRARGVDVPELAPATIARLSELLPPLTYQRNPVDTGRPGPSFRQVLEAVAADPAIDVTVVYALIEPEALHPAAVSSVADPPAVFATGGPAEQVTGAANILRSYGIAVATSPEGGARAVAALVADARARARPRISPDLPGVDVPPGPLDEDRAKAVLDALGFVTPRRIACADRDEALRAAETLGWPLVVKVLDAAVLHKTEAGGVHVGITDRAALERALDAIRPGPVLVERQAPPGVELLVGARRDPAFGPVVAVGLGGVTAEALGDVAMRLAPVGHAEARAMLDELRLSMLLDGFRGLPVVDRGALAAAAVALGGLVAGNPRVTEVEVNPLRATADGLVALDCVLETT